MKKALTLLVAVALTSVALLIGVSDSGEAATSALDEHWDVEGVEEEVHAEMDRALGAIEVGINHLTGQDAFGSFESWEVCVDTAVNGVCVDLPPEDVRINFEAGTARVNTTIAGCGLVKVTWHVTGGQNEFRGHFTGPSGEERIEQGIEKVANDVIGIVCGFDIADAFEVGGEMGRVAFKEAGF